MYLFELGNPVCFAFFGPPVIVNVVPLFTKNVMINKKQMHGIFLQVALFV